MNQLNIFKVNELINIIKDDLFKENCDRFFIDYQINKITKHNELYQLITNKQIIDIINNNIENYKLINIKEINIRNNGNFKGRGFYPDGTINISFSLIFDKL